MPVLALQSRPSLFTEAGHSEAPFTLSSGAIAGITVAGSVLLFLIVVGPLLVRLAKRRDSRRKDTGLVSSLPLAEHRYVEADESCRTLRRLHKRGVASEHAIDLGIKDVWIEGAKEGQSKHHSLPDIPPVFPRPGSFAVDDDFSGRTSKDGESVNGGRSHGSPEKRRGYVIHQNRRKMSWIDEDALHGPRILPRESTGKKMHWFIGNGLTRTLSRRFTIRRHHALELEQSPTLPCTGEILQPNLTTVSVGGPSQGVDNRQRQRKLSIAVEKRSQFASRPPLQRGASLADDRNRIVKPIPQQIRVPAAVRPARYGHSDSVINAAQQLAGRARVPSVDVEANGRRYSGPQPGGRDAELQAILRRTAERLQDGNQSARRQTLMLPHSRSSKLPGQLKLVTNQEWARGRGRVMPEDMASSPARSQKSAPAVMSNSVSDAGSLGLPQGPQPQTIKRRLTHRRTHARQVSEVSMLSEPDSLAVGPSSLSSQADLSVTPLSSPDRTVPASPAHARQVSDPSRYSPASVSSALSTVYSEEEGSPTTSISKGDSVPKGAREPEKTVVPQAPPAGDALHEQPKREGNDDKKELRGQYQTDQGPRSFNSRAGTLNQTPPSSTQHARVSDSATQDGIGIRRARKSPKATSTFTVQTPNSEIDDPFMNCTKTPNPTPRRMSQICSPLPPKLSPETAGPSGLVTEPLSPTPTSSRRPVIPPPERLYPSRSSPTLGACYDLRSQIQQLIRAPSPVASEGGLSSVYESYQYSRHDGPEDSPQLLTQVGAATKLAVPQSNTSPANHIPSRMPARSLSSRSSGSFKKAYSRGNSGLDNAMPQAMVRSHSVKNPRLLTAGNIPTGTSYTMRGSLSRYRSRRDISTGNVSEISAASVYSQDDDGTDKLAPLIPLPAVTRSLSRHPMRVTSAVAQLRRMDSQISCVSEYSTTTTNMAGPVEMASPTLPALRGGGCSPGKRGVGGGTKNYLSLGGGLATRAREGERSPDSGRGGVVQHGKQVAEVEIREDMVIGIRGKGTKDGTTLRRGGLGRPRRQTVVGGYEQDLNHARHILRENRGCNLQAIPEGSRKSLIAGEPTTPVAKAKQDEGRASLESLGIYDDKGFLRSSPKKDRTPRE